MKRLGIFLLLLALVAPVTAQDGPLSNDWVTNIAHEAYIPHTPAPSGLPLGVALLMGIAWAGLVSSLPMFAVCVFALADSWRNRKRSAAAALCLMALTPAISLAQDGPTASHETIAETAEPHPFPRGAIPTDQDKIEAAAAFTPLAQAAERFAVVPAHLQYWGNDRYGICVTAEEAFAKLAYSKMCGDDEIRVSDSDCIAWARRHGVLNGADLLDVMTMVAKDGLPANGKLYTDGVPHRVNWKDEEELRAAIASGPVKLGIQAGDLPRGAGSSSGWWIIRNVPGGREDHAVALCGYGPASYLYGEMGLPVPEGLAADKQGYLLFTWSTIGFVSHDWLMGAVGEAWVRVPTTVGEAPKPPEPTPEPPAPTQDHTAFLIALIVVGVIAAGLGVLWVMSQKKDK